LIRGQTKHLRGDSTSSSTVPAMQIQAQNTRSQISQISTLKAKKATQYGDYPQHQSVVGPSRPIHEKLTNLGSRGSPSGPMLFFLKRSCMYNRRASSKLTPLLFMIVCTSRFAASSSPCRESPASRFAFKSKAEDESPASISSRKEVGRRV
jgi:hypothetical protein